MCARKKWQVANFLNGTGEQDKYSFFRVASPCPAEVLLLQGQRCTSCAHGKGNSYQAAVGISVFNLETMYSLHKYWLIFCYISGTVARH